MVDHSTMRLGKRHRRHDARTLKMARYLASGLPAAPPAVDYTRGVTDFGMMLNDRLGCCTIAAVGHAIQVWRLNASGAPSVGHSASGVGNRASGIGRTARPTPHSPLPAPPHRRESMRPQHVIVQASHSLLPCPLFLIPLPPRQREWGARTRQFATAKPLTGPIPPAPLPPPSRQRD